MAEYNNTLYCHSCSCAFEYKVRYTMNMNDNYLIVTRCIRSRKAGKLILLQGKFGTKYILLYHFD